MWDNSEFGFVNSFKSPKTSQIQIQLIWIWVQILFNAITKWLRYSVHKFETFIRFPRIEKKSIYIIKKNFQTCLKRWNWFYNLCHVMTWFFPMKTNRTVIVFMKLRICLDMTAVYRRHKKPPNGGQRNFFYRSVPRADMLSRLWPAVTCCCYLINHRCWQLYERSSMRYYAIQDARDKFRSKSSPIYTRCRFSFVGF